MTRRHLPDAPLLAAAAGRTPSHTPVWMMRQAGRSLPEYREARGTTTMLDSCFDPELLAEITLQPVRRHKVDAAILFSDIVVPLKAAGIGVTIVPGRGPVMDAPVRDAAAVAALPQVTPEDLAAVASGIGIILEELSDTQALIGFAGAPFTVASYLVEGGPSRNHEITKALMHSDTQTWHALMDHLTETVLTFLRVQLDAGIDALQLFDSWAGFLSKADYREFVLPYSQRIFAELADAGVPRIHFGVGTGELLGSMAEAGCDVIGVDYRVNMAEAAARVHSHLSDPATARSDGATVLALQGNLDPALLFADMPAIQRGVDTVLSQVAAGEAAGHSRGHIFNLGHGVLPTTDAGVITDTVAYIHSR